MMILITLLFLAWIPSSVISQGGCYDENGRADWVIMVKYPGAISNRGSYGGEAYKYAYISSNNPHDRLKQANLDMMASNGPMAKLFSQFTAGAADKGILYMAWNDHTPQGLKVSASYAHSKGFILYNKNEGSGFIVQHSIPRFPAFEGESDIPSHTMPDNKFGQTLFCLGFKDENFFKLMLKQLTIANVYFYKGNIPKNMWEEVAHRAKRDSYTLNPSHIKGGGFMHPLTLGHNSSTGLVLFTKTPMINNHVFDDLIQHHLKINMTVESWGRPYRTSTCSDQFATKNIKTISISSWVKWERTQDHSKWGVSIHYDKPWTCISDLNRMDSQTKRGGIAFCLMNFRVQKAFQNIVRAIEECGAAPDPQDDVPEDP